MSKHQILFALAPIPKFLTLVVSMKRDSALIHLFSIVEYCLRLPEAKNFKSDREVRNTCAQNRQQKRQAHPK